MSKQDYEVIAAIIAMIADPMLRTTMADHFAKQLHDQNPRFNIVKFKAACRRMPSGQHITEGISLRNEEGKLPE